MTLVEDQISAARKAARTLEQAAEALAEHYASGRSSLDAQRLRLDARRLSEDLDLLVGPASPPPPPPAPPPVQREIIPDTTYTHDFWMDAEDEGLGRWSSPGR